MESRVIAICCLGALVAASGAQAGGLTVGSTPIPHPAGGTNPGIADIPTLPKPVPGKPGETISWWNTGDSGYMKPDPPGHYWSYQDNGRQFLLQNIRNEHLYKILTVTIYSDSDQFQSPGQHFAPKKWPTFEGVSSDSEILSASSFRLDDFTFVGMIQVRFTPQPALEYVRFANLETSLSKFRRVVFEVSCVPEPGSWAMMVVGFGLMGGAIRRQRVLVAG